ncbi:MAG: DUF3830 family protein [Candidatus Liptonbacteria bacterium]|nr:DUF3830 family protein [Candidatus Liptonbacteria bacterium]
MSYIKIITPDNTEIRFRPYISDAPQTCAVFLRSLPIAARAVQARFAGEEIWIPEGPALSIPQENATIELKPGELGYAPPTPRNSVGRSIAIVYGEAKLSDCVNVFAVVFDEDLDKLKQLGERIWLGGACTLQLQAAD